VGLTLDTSVDVELIDLLINTAIYRDLNFPIFLIDHVHMEMCMHMKFACTI